MKEHELVIMLQELRIAFPYFTESIKAFYDELLKTGFNEEQALDLSKVWLNNVTKLK